MYSAIKDQLQHELDEIRSAGLFKTERHIDSPQANHIKAGQIGESSADVLNFCANNYLGLADHPEIIDAAGVIEDNGVTIYDDLMHGFGGGYFPPILGSRSRPAGPLPEMTLKENMTVVVQPNVITQDQRAGVQVGELVHITDRGFERLHKAPRALFRVG